MRKNNLSKYFYSEGIRFKCQECGSCCDIEDGVVYLTSKDMINISAFLNLDLEIFRKKYTSKTEDGFTEIKDTHPSICIFHKNNKCSIYPARPIQCRLYPFWSTLMKKETVFFKEKCPGIGKGDLVNFDKITDSIIAHRKFLIEIERT